jgi:hypothetical protein
MAERVDSNPRYKNGSTSVRGCLSRPTEAGSKSIEYAIILWTIFRPRIRTHHSNLENIKLVQIRIGILFSLCLVIGLRARRGDAGLHKRMMILATAIPLPAGIDRIHWLQTTQPGSPLSTMVGPIPAVSPMFVWDVIRNRSDHRAYRIWLGLSLPVFVVEYVLWDTSWWHATARQIMGI